MECAELLKLQAEAAFNDFLQSVEGVTQEQAWAKAELRPGEYLHTEGSILSQVAHVAGCRFMYASAGYKDLEIRWRDVVARMESFWPDWEAAKEWLKESYSYWLDAWGRETDFERMVEIPQGRSIPSWKAIWIVTNHDGYHAGQIQILRATLAPTFEPPPSESEDWKKYCKPLPTW